MSIDVNKILKLIQMIENEDGENLSLGSIRTLGMIKKELSKELSKDDSNWLDSQPFESYKKYLNKCLTEKMFYKTDIQEIEVGDIVKNENGEFGKVTYIDDEVIIIEFQDSDRVERYFPDEINNLIKQNKIQISGA